MRVLRVNVRDAVPTPERLTLQPAETKGVSRSGTLDALVSVDQEAFPVTLASFQSTNSNRRPGESVLTTSLSPEMSRVLALADGVAPTPATVLLSGESGTGKEILARHIHCTSQRSQNAFVAINCGAMPATLVESELFGHERGAFSGAIQRRVGRFEAAHRGTLLLDEVSEMPLDLQTRLLRILQERELVRVGGSNTVSVDVRVIATTNRDLKKMIAADQFREDLYYRINVFPIHVPSLRDRLEDLAALSEAILVRLCRRFGCPVVTLGDDALRVLSRWRWPGNVRELQNVLERALILSRGDVIGAEHVMLDSMTPSPTPCGPTQPATANVGGAPSLRDVEQEIILTTLISLDGNRTRAAEQLGISLRTLRNRLRTYRSLGIQVPPPTRGVAADIPHRRTSCR